MKSQLRIFNRSVRWLRRGAGLFLAFFAFELLSGPYQTSYLGAADPYIGAMIAYVVGGTIVAFSIGWILGGLYRMFAALFR